MNNYELVAGQHLHDAALPVRIVRHAQVCEKLKVSGAKLYDMVAKGIFPRPFVIIPGGRSVGWIESDVDAWILERSADQRGGAQ